jgi:hypothetical protein
VDKVTIDKNGFSFESLWERVIGGGGWVHFDPIDPNGTQVVTAIYGIDLDPAGPTLPTPTEGRTRRQ